jgi:hypothetical protein
LYRLLIAHITLHSQYIPLIAVFRDKGQILAILHGRKDIDS